MGGGAQPPAPWPYSTSNFSVGSPRKTTLNRASKRPRFGSRGKFPPPFMVHSHSHTLRKKVPVSLWDPSPPPPGGEQRPGKASYGDKLSRFDLGVKSGVAGERKRLGALLLGQAPADFLSGKEDCLERL